ncbi:MAG: hypothetical protein K8S13_09520 [Desulfobacula sp.]|uniref:hypothetical protein n=1 Tax=Desulfobacula sp. TaxID=2593537 RepID=UPI0025C5966E|nr:hypothetical protein [Desulfobacula sp.]MCD4720082.1 hypothetical protein [Desulfobacula sp.]
MMTMNKQGACTKLKILIFIAISLSIAGWAGCTTTTTHSRQSQIQFVSEMAPVALVKKMNQSEFKKFTSKQQTIGNCVMADTVYNLYWLDELQLDFAVVKPSSNDQYDLIKVKKVGERQVQVEEGVLNNKSYRKVKLINE